MNHFDVDTHTYYIDNIPCPSITQLLPEQNFYVSPEHLEELKEEGKDSHSFIKMFYDTNDTFGIPMLDALRLWINDNKIMLGELVLYEKPLYSLKYRYAGTPDAIYEKAIIEYKRSPGDPKLRALQTAGQAVLSHENRIAHKTKKHIVAWFDGVKFKSKNVYNEKAEDVFLGLVKMHWINKALETYMQGA